MSQTFYKPNLWDNPSAAARSSPTVIFFLGAIMNGAVCGSEYGTKWLTVDTSNAGFQLLKNKQFMSVLFLSLWTNLPYKTVNQRSRKAGTSQHARGEQLLGLASHFWCRRSSISCCFGWKEILCIQTKPSTPPPPSFDMCLIHCPITHTLHTTCLPAWHLSPSASLDLNTGNTNALKWVRIWANTPIRTMMQISFVVVPNTRRFSPVRDKYLSKVSSVWTAAWWARVQNEGLWSPKVCERASSAA